MRVLFVSGEYPPMQGGVGDYMWSLGSALQAQGVDVHVLTSCEAGPRHLLPTGVANVYPEVAGWGWGLLRQVRASLVEIEPSILHIQYQSAAYRLHPAINLLPRSLGGFRDSCCVAVTFHDLRVPYLFPKAGPLRWRMNLEPANASQLVIVTNAEDRDCLRQYSRLADKLAEIPIGANIQPEPPTEFDRDQQRARWGVGPEDLLLCYFGFLNDSKGGEELMLTLAQLASSGWPVHLLMIGGQVGASDPTNVRYLDRVKALVESLGVQDRVFWTGFVPADEVSANFLASDIAVLPYRDGASFRRGSLMAALAHGLPIVSTEPAVRIPEMQHGENIWLVPPLLSEALAEAVERLAREPDLRRRLGLGAQRLAGNFTWHAIARRHLEAYGELV
jgi:glycosyltransferase involved in cell wall biosynthesis